MPFHSQKYRAVSTKPVPASHKYQGPQQTHKAIMVYVFIVPSCVSGEAAFSQYGINLTSCILAFLFHSLLPIPSPPLTLHVCWSSPDSFMSCYNPRTLKKLPKQKQLQFKNAVFWWFKGTESTQEKDWEVPKPSKRQDMGFHVKVSGRETEQLTSSTEPSEQIKVPSSVCWMKARWVTCRFLHYTLAKRIKEDLTFNLHKLTATQHN